jgi:alpha-N-arabinofuranosidase
MSFEARATGDVQNCALGLGLCDQRGWTATNSAIAIEGLQAASDWTKFTGRFTTLDDCPGIKVLWRLLAKKGAPVSGTVEVRNLKITATKVSNLVSGYATVTASASLSNDGKTLYLIVFNKDLNNDTPVQIALKGLGTVTSVRRWMVTGPSLTALNFDNEEVREVESGVAMPLPQQGLLDYTTPARSMTAIEVHMK